MSRLEPFIAKQLGSAGRISSCSGNFRGNCRHRNEMPYCDTASKPDFQTSVTSQALVACNLQERKAETAFPPTARNRVSLSCLGMAISNLKWVKDRQ